jgi:hypothetical protein
VIPFDGNLRRVRAPSGGGGICRDSTAKRFHQRGNSFRDTGGYHTSRLPGPTGQSRRQAAKNDAEHAEAAGPPGADRQLSHTSNRLDLARQSEGEFAF